jgi:hypothetical protein
LTRRSAGAAAAFVALTLLPGCAAAGSSVTPGSPGDAPSRAARTTRSIPSVRGSNKSIAWRKLRWVLAQAAVLPGGRAVRHSPVAALDKPPQTIGSPNFLEATGWWTAPGTVSEALDYLRGHPPAGLRDSGHGTFTSPGVVVESLLFDGQPTDAYNQFSLVVAVTRMGDGVAVRVDAESVWLPRRTAAEHIDGTLTSVDVSVARPGVAPTVHRTVRGRRAQMLATVVNQRPVQPRTFSCPIDRGYTDTLRFHVDGPDVLMRAEVEGCGTVQVTVSRRTQPALQGGLAVDRAVTAALRTD